MIKRLSEIEVGTEAVERSLWKGACGRRPSGNGDLGEIRGRDHRIEGRLIQHEQHRYSDVS